MSIDPNVDFITWTTWFDDVNQVVAEGDALLLQLEQPGREFTFYAPACGAEISGGPNEASYATVADAANGVPGVATTLALQAASAASASTAMCHVHVTDVALLSTLESLTLQKIGPIDLANVDEDHPFWSRQSSRNVRVIDDAVLCVVTDSQTTCALCDGSIFPGETVTFAATLTGLCYVNTTGLCYVNTTGLCYAHPYHATCGASLKARELDVFRMGEEPPMCLCMASNEHQTYKK